MCVKLPPRDLNLVPYFLHLTSIYTCGMTTAPRVYGGVYINIYIAFSVVCIFPLNQLCTCTMSKRQRLMMFSQSKWQNHHKIKAREMLTDIFRALVWKLFFEIFYWENDKIINVVDSFLYFPRKWCLVNQNDKTIIK